MKIKLGELQEKIDLGLEKLGYSGEDKKIIRDVLLYAQMRGNNQGVAKIAAGGVPQASSLLPLRLVKENKAGALFSGGHSMVASTKAADKAVELAAQHGVGIAATNQTFTSSGAIGYFARRVAKAGFIALVFVGNGDWAVVAPTGAAEAKLGTNPLAYAFPYTGGEVVFDTATAAIAYYGLIEAKLKGEPLPEGVAITNDGQPTTDATAVLGSGGDEAMGGALKTFAGHKGFGLSLLVQLLGSAFSLAGFAGAYADDGGGTVIIAIDPGLLAGKEEYMKRATELMQTIKGARTIPGQQISLPGERGDNLAAEATKNGEVEIAAGVWQELLNFVGS